VYTDVIRRAPRNWKAITTDVLRFLTAKETKQSLTRIAPTLERLVFTMAGVLLLLVFVYPFHHPAAGFVCFLLVALVLFLARLVMTDTDNPFEGVCNVSPQPFGELGF
jgi:Flp pilus assembly protein TadB